MISRSRGSIVNTINELGKDRVLVKRKKERRSTVLRGNRDL